MTTPRTSPQSRKLHAILGDVVRQYPLIPYRRTFAHEAWKRYLIAHFIREMRWGAWQAGAPDPFPVRPVPSSELDSQQMSELLEFAQAWAAMNDVPLSK